MKIHAAQPGSGFPEAFLLGNGWMGQAMNFDPRLERITLSHVTFFSGKPMVWTEDEGAHASAFREMRAAALIGDWDAVREASERFIGEKQEYGTSLPVGTLCIAQPGLQNITGYERELDLNEGIARCGFSHRNGRQTWTAFCSHPDQVFVLQIRDDSLGGLTARISLEDGITSQAYSGGIAMTAQALETRHSDGKCGVRLAGTLLAETEDGASAAEGGALTVCGCHLLTVYLSMQTDASDREADWDALMDLSAKICVRAKTQKFDGLYERHTSDFSDRMRRVELELPDDPDAQTMFALGRYLTLSASREDSPAPMSLQGVWNDGVACRIGWTCDMHLDINTQMNHWLCGPGRLPESRIPLLRWMQSRLIPEGEKAAAFFYGMPGWSAELVSNLYGFAAPYWNRSLAPSPECGMWQAEDFAEQWRFTMSGEFLTSEVMPALGGAVDFCLSYLFRDKEGRLHCGPSISPENAFQAGGKKQFAALDMPFAWAAIRGLMESYLECAEAAEQENERTERIRAILPECQTPQIQPDGELSEFPLPLEALDPQHRHMSHLLGLYPFHQIRAGTPEGAAAAVSIRKRLTPYENWEDTGWARTMLALYSARLRQGEQAYFHLHEMLRCLTGLSGLVMHPSTRGASSFAPVWELDGNTGFAAAVAEMLLQSQGGMISLLPALPSSWKNGSFRGMGARGGFSVACEWANGELTRAEVRNESGSRSVVTIEWNSGRQVCRLAPGEAVTLSPDKMREVM